jgi:hypothetical protein
MGEFILGSDTLAAAHFCEPGSSFDVAIAAVFHLNPGL